MFRVLLPILFSFSVLTFSQEDSNKKFKNSEVIRCGQTGFGIIVKKDKSGLFHFKNKTFVIKPDNSFYHYFDNYGLLFRANSEGLISVYNLLATKNSDQVPQALTNMNSAIINSFGSGNFINGNFLFDKAKLYLYNDSLILSSDSLSLVNDSTLVKSTEENFYFGIEKHDQIVIVKDFHDEYWNQSYVAVRSISYPDEDSIDQHGNVVYYPRKAGYQISGAYNLTTKSWEIPRKYKEIRKYHNIYICLKEGQDTVISNDNEYYDFYLQNGTSISKTSFQNVVRNSGFPYSLVFEPGKFQIDPDSSLVYIETNSGYGLLRVQLFNPYWLDHTYHSQTESVSRLQLDTIIEPVYNFVVKSGRDNPFYIAQKDSVFYLSRYDYYDDDLKAFQFTTNFSDKSINEGYNTYIFDNKLYQDTSYNYDFELIGEAFFNALDSKKGVVQINDTLIYIQNWEREDGANNFGKGDLVLYEGYYNEDGSNQYYLPMPGVYESGVYNKQSHSWWIEPENAYILFKNDTFLVCKPILSQSANIEDYSFTLKSLNNEEIKHFSSFNNWIHSKEYLSFLFPQFLNYSLNQLDPKYPEFYLVSNKLKKGIIDVNKGITVINPSDFVFFDPYFNLQISFNEGLLKTKYGVFQNVITITNNVQLSLYESQYYQGFAWVDSSKVIPKVHLFNNSNTEEQIHSIQGSDFSKYLSRKKVVEPVMEIVSFDNNHIYFRNFKADKIVEDIEVPENYLTDFKGEKVITKKIIKGYQNSGLYDLSKNKWLIFPEYKWIKKCDNETYITCKNVYTENNHEETSYYSLFDAKGDVIFSNKLAQECDKEYKQYLE